MRQEKFTPGTIWHACPDAGYETYGQSIVYDAGTSKWIAAVYDGAAHSDLIAAAPEMYEALQAVIREFVPSRDKFTSMQQEAAFNAAKAAIAKAEGNQ